MKKKNRLTGAEIRGLRSPRRIHGGLFSVSVSKSAGSDARCACVVSKKVAMSAVARNTIKRRCRAALDARLGTLPAGAYVFYAKKESARASYAAIQKDIDALAKELRGA